MFLFCEFRAGTNFNWDLRQFYLKATRKHLLHIKIQSNFIGINTLIIRLMCKVVFVFFTLSGNEVTTAGCALTVAVKATGTYIVDANDFAGCFINTPI